jgi:hypothetical protein
MPDTHGIEMSGGLDAHATSTGRDHGRCKFAVIPRGGSRCRAGSAYNGTTRSFVHADPLLIQSLSAAIERRCAIGVRQCPVLSLSLRPSINRGENCDAEEERNEDQSQYARGQLLSLQTMRHVSTLLDGRRVLRRTSHRDTQPSNEIPVGRRRRRSNDMPAPVVDTDTGPWGGDDPADCHWNAQPQAHAASRAAAQDVGILRVL